MRVGGKVSHQSHKLSKACFDYTTRIKEYFNYIMIEVDLYVKLRTNDF